MCSRGFVVRHLLLRVPDKVQESTVIHLQIVEMAYASVPHLLMHVVYQVKLAFLEYANVGHLLRAKI